MGEFAKGLETELWTFPELVVPEGVVHVCLDVNVAGAASAVFCLRLNAFARFFSKQSSAQPKS